MKLNLSIGILSWGSHQTLRNTLQSYKSSGLFDLTDDVSIFFQETCAKDLEIAAEFGISNVMGSPTNIGIGAALTELARNAKEEYWIGLENDWKNICSPEITYDRISSGIHLLTYKKADAIRYRHRRQPGEPLYTITYRGRETDSLMHIIECCHWRENPDIAFPQYISKDLITGYYLANSRYANFTNNPTMYKRQFYLDNVSQFSGDLIALEGNIETFWKEGNFTVAMGEGLFCHTRLDR